MNEFDPFINTAPFFIMGLPKFMMNSAFQKQRDQYTASVLKFHETSCNLRCFQIPRQLLPIPYNTLSKKGLEEAQLEYLHYHNIEHLYLDLS